MLTRLALALALLLLAPSSPALALRILIVNDDGLTSNVVALQKALVAAGHEVLVSVPCTGQSGRSGALVMYSTTTIVADNDRTQVEAEGGCHNGAASVGAPAAGPFTKAGFTNGDFHYVHGTPVMATLYGLDVLAPATWKAAPDLVVSGPNEGQNAGLVVLNSGTIANAQVAASRGVPTIAVSAGTDTVDNKALADPESAVVAALTLTLIDALRASAGPGAPLLPSGMALNVNVPNAPTRDTAFAITRIGTFQRYLLSFKPTAPYGMAVRLQDPAAAAADQQHDEAVVVGRGVVAVTPMQVGYDVAAARQDGLRDRLSRLVR